MMQSAPPSRNPVNARIQRLESRASAAELVAAVRDDFLVYDRKPANTSRHHWMWPVPPLAKDMPINWLLEHLLYLGTRLTSRDGPKVSNGSGPARQVGNLEVGNGLGAAFYAVQEEVNSAAIAVVQYRGCELTLSARNGLLRRWSQSRH